MKDEALEEVATRVVAAAHDDWVQLVEVQGHLIEVAEESGMPLLWPDDGSPKAWASVFPAALASVKPLSEVALCARTGLKECDISAADASDAAVEWGDAWSDLTLAVGRSLNNDRLYYPHSVYPLG